MAEASAASGDPQVLVRRSHLVALLKAVELFVPNAWDFEPFIAYADYLRAAEGLDG